MKKLELLTELCTIENAQSIVDELGLAMTLSVHLYKHVFIKEISPSFFPLVLPSLLPSLSPSFPPSLPPSLPSLFPFLPSLPISLLLSPLSSEYATDVNVMVARKAIQAVGCIALRLSARANTCVDKLLSLLTMDVDYITAETLVAMTSECLS